MSEAKTRLLDIAEQVFIERGFTGSSVRAITTAAGVNLASVSYYFGTKEALFREIVSRRLRPVNRRRRELRTAAEALSAGTAAQVERILEAFVLPLLGPEQEQLRHLIGRVHAEPAQCVRAAFVAECDAVSHHFAVALERTLPYLEASEVAVRLQFAISILVHTCAGLRYHERTSSDADVFRDMVLFISAGLTAPIVGRVGSSHSPFLVPATLR